MEIAGYIAGVATGLAVIGAVFGAVAYGVFRLFTCVFGGSDDV